MGSEVYLHARAGTQSFVARVGPSMVAEVNQSVAFAFNMRKGHFFDTASGAVI
jgi:ABC-type sugar transport system ATPase subunit